MVIALLIGSQFIQSQDQKVVQEAIVKSYALETAKKQNEAIEILKSLSNSENYPTKLRLARFIHPKDFKKK